MDPLLDGLSENRHMPGVVGKHDEYCFLQSAEPTEFTSHLKLSGPDARPFSQFSKGGTVGKRG